MKWLIAVMGFVVAAGLMTGCGVRVDVCNDTTFGVQATVTTVNGTETRSPSHQHCSSVDAGQGPYSVNVERLDDWLTYAEDRRQALEAILKDTTTMSPSRVEDLKAVLAQLKRRIARFEKAKQGDSCAGWIDKDEYALAVVDRAPDGSLTITCRSAKLDYADPWSLEEP